MTTTTAPPRGDDEPRGPAYWAHRRHGRPMPPTEEPTTPEAWHRARFQRKDDR